MALSNYAELKAAIYGVDSFSHRDDIGNLVDDFIAIMSKGYRFYRQ